MKDKENKGLLIPETWEDKGYMPENTNSSTSPVGEGQGVRLGVSSFWRQDGHDYIADIGTMKKAVIIRKFAGGFYKISEGSYWPFTNDVYETRCTVPVPLMQLAEKTIKEWAQSLFLSSPTKSITSDQQPNLSGLL